MTDSLTRRLKHFRLFDKTLLAHWILLSLLILIFAGNNPNWRLQIAGNILLVSLLILLIPIADRKSGKIIHFFRHAYIIFILPLLYWQIGPLLHTVHAGEFDTLILSFDRFLFGALPNIWVQSIVNPWLTEFMQISYGVYWITIPLGGGIFYFSKQYRHYEYLMFFVTIAFFLSYYCFILFPVAGPRFYIADQITAQYQGLFLTQYLREFMTHAGYRGGAFPSSHVGVAVTILIFVWKFRPKLAATTLLPLVTALSLATVYGQYHYFSDMLSGLIMGLAMGLPGARYAARKLLLEK